jgi:hypothetical protein
MTIDDLEEGCLDGSLVGGIVSDFYSCQPLQPIPQMITNEAPEIHGDDFVCGLRLTIRLRVEGGGEIQYDVGQSEQLLPKLACKHGIPVADYGVENAMEADNLAEECFGIYGA